MKLKGDIYDENNVVLLTTREKWPPLSTAGTLLLAWISNYIHYKVWVISSHALLGMYLFIHIGIKVKPC